MRKAQGAFEYVLLLGGVLLIVVLAVVLLRGGLFESSSQNVQLSACQNALVTAPGCFADGVWQDAIQVPVSTSCYATLDNAGYDCVVLDQTCECGTQPG
ncbi:MAG: class III signal peptide-containing protein [Candidatus Micrarchaeia archaeon]